MENKLSIENNVVEDVIHESFNVLGEEIEFGVNDFINEFFEKGLPPTKRGNPPLRNKYSKNS